MLAAAGKAFFEIFSRPFRAVLIKSMALAALLLVIIGVALHRLLSWLATSGGAWLEGMLGSGAQGPLGILLWIFALAAGLGLVLGAVFLMPAVTALVASFFIDDIAEVVERTHYPADPPGTALPVLRALSEGLKTALLAVGVYLLAVPFLFFAGLGVVVFFLATAFLLGREYFLLAAMRFRDADKAKSLRRQHANSVLLAGMLIAAMVSIPILNLVTPLFGTALMVHLHKRIAAQSQAPITSKT